MDKKLEDLPLKELKEMAKAKKIKGYSRMKKEELLKVFQEEKKKERKDPMDYQPKKENRLVHGSLEILSEGYGFVRNGNYQSDENDIYVSPTHIRRFRLKKGDVLLGYARKNREGDRFAALFLIQSINGHTIEESLNRKNFDSLTPIFPNERLHLELKGQEASVAMRIVDLLSPIGKGQRGLIVSPPKAGKTTLLKQVAGAIVKGNSKIHVLILLIDERPEEVTDMKEAFDSPNVEVVYSTFDETPDHHRQISEFLIERAKRLVEYGEDVVILLDSITRLARAYNLTVPPSGRTLSGGLDPAALHMPKRFFGAARNLREGGSLTILATALVETGSKMDDVIYEEFKGTGNMELVLSRKLQERRVFPAIDIPKSGTRREDLLLSEKEKKTSDRIHRMISGQYGEDAVESLLNTFAATKNNEEFMDTLAKNAGFRNKKK